MKGKWVTVANTKAAKNGVFAVTKRAAKGQQTLRAVRPGNGAVDGAVGKAFTVTVR